MKKLGIIGICLLAFLGCAPEKVVPDAPMAVGHGGCGFDTYRNTIPPNTLAAMEQGAWVESAGGLEMDIQMTSDSALILYHNTDLAGYSDCGGCVSSYTLAEIQTCRLASRNGSPDGIFTIPRLEEILATFHESDLHFFLNVKSHDPCVQSDLPHYYARFARELSVLLERYDLFDRAYVETYDLNFLLACRSVDSRFRFIFDVEEFKLGLQTSLDQDFVGFAIPNESVTEAQVAQAQAQGKWVIIWGVKILAGTQEAVAKHPDVIMTDDVPMLQEVIHTP